MLSLKTILPLLPALAAGVLACADLSSTAPEPSVVNVACTNSFNGATSIFGWELRVMPTTEVRAGEPFRTELSGTAVFSEDFLSTAQPVSPVELHTVNVIELSATVHVRSGAAGEDRKLAISEDTPYTCFLDGVECDYDNHNLAGDPGHQPNSDCQPMSELNPCGRFFEIPRNDDCGECAGLSSAKGQACQVHGYCITRDLRIDLEPGGARYTADSNASAVLFGWDDMSTGAREVQNEVGQNVWELPSAPLSGGAGPNSLRVDLLPGADLGFATTIAFECTMGVSTEDSRVEDPDVISASPTPSEMLITIPVEAR